jgi:hypothetical protein
MFLFTDAHVADEGFLELVNNMLTSGMVPALYDDAGGCRARAAGHWVWAIRLRRSPISWFWRRC